jgi:hypothetical protein
MNMHSEEDSVKGGWFSTSDMKLAVALQVAGFPFKKDAECTRFTDSQNREIFTWHFETVNSDGEKIVNFLPAWESDGLDIPRPSNLISFLIARESMFVRSHVMSESHKVPRASLRNRGDKQLLVSARLRREDRLKLAQLAS